MKYFGCVFLTFALLLALLMIALPSQAAIATEITIERFVYDGQVSFDYDEYVKICNISGGDIDLGGTNPWRIGDEESASGGTEGMFDLQGTLNAGDCFIIADNANAFNSIWGFLPDYEMEPTAGVWTDNASVPNLSGSGNWGLNNTLSTGDNITLWKYNTSPGSYEKHDEVAYGTDPDRYTEVGLPTIGTYQISCSGNVAITRNDVNTDTDNMADDFNCTDNPNAVTLRNLTASRIPLTPIALALSLLGLAAVGGAAFIYRRRA